jgi:hypothetical protein
MAKTLEAVAGDAQAKLAAAQAAIDAKFEHLFNQTGLLGIRAGYGDESFPISSLEFVRQVHNRAMLPSDRKFLFEQCCRRRLIKD